MEMTPQRWDATASYLGEVFGREDDDLRGLKARAAATGLPDIAVSAEVGRLLALLARMSGDGRGASLIVEVGTLAGYSALWLARGLRPEGRLITIEMDPRHADFAQSEFRRAGTGHRIIVRRGRALDVLPALASELGRASVDVAFIDAAKTEYPDYYRVLKPMLRPGGLLIADNALGSASWWIDSPEPNPDRDAVDRFNRAVAADPDFEAAAVPIRQGVLIARRRS
jgi:predicted O-methyltransferase YrrM